MCSMCPNLLNPERFLMIPLCGRALTMERLLDLTNYIIDHMVNDAGGHVREVIETLSDLDFTEEELIEVFHFSETDVKVCLAYADKDKEVE